ncbi:hypothetical protein D3C73_1039610 [compost metagenome]
MLQAGGPQGLGHQAVLVHGYPAQAAAHAVGKGNDAGVAERLAEDHIIAFRQAADRYQQAMLGAGGQHHLLRASFGQPALNPCGASLLVRRMATVGNVVEHLVKVGGSRQLGNRSAQPVGHVRIVGLDDRKVDLAAFVLERCGPRECGGGRRRSLLQDESTAANLAHHQAPLGGFVIGSANGARRHVQ